MPAEVKLSPFQTEKLECLFKYLEPNADGKLNAESLDRVMKKTLEFTKWPKDSAKALQCREIHETFFEILWEKTLEEGGSDGVSSLEDWYHIWSHLLYGCKGMSNFPVWLRLLPKIFFEMIDRNSDDLIKEEELLNFYKEMVKVQAEDLVKETKEAFSDMTDEGRYPLNLDGYEQIFANFLIGKTPHGPGKYIFGLFRHDKTDFELISPAAPDCSDSSRGAESQYFVFPSTQMRA